MDKSLLIKVIVVAVVLFFVVEMFAFGVLSNPNPTPSSGPQKVSEYSGNVQLSGTVVSYRPTLLVRGEGRALREAIEPLVSSGFIIYFGSPSESNETVLNLASNANVREVAKNLSERNLTVTASAVVSLPARFNLTTPEGEMEVEGTSFEISTQQFFSENETVELSMDVVAQNGRLLQINNLFVLQQRVALEATGTVSRVLGTTFVAQIPFAQRRIDRAMAREIFAQEGYVIEVREVSYLAFDSPLSQEQLSKITFPYVTLARERSISLDPSFTNSSRLEGDFASIGLNVSAPYSTIRVSSNRTNASVENEGELVLSLARSVASESTLKPAQTVEITLPAIGYSEGKEISNLPAKATVLLPGTHQIGEVVDVRIRGYASGSRLVSVEEVFVPESETEAG